MKKTIAGIIIFAVQLGLAIFYNRTIDLVIVAILAIALIVYVARKYAIGNYGSA